ncbi:MAG: hypothetical protein DRO99_01040 [Candidatus Aenigmatarchaeota archaeon]|nr:MAG: hypothetical protein DRO99_01040 [Candidatus Aenigmarchaeota archaeon]
MALTEYSFSKLPIEETYVIRKGATFYQPFKLYLNGDPWDLSNATVKFIVKDDSGNEIVSQELASSDMDSAATGEFTIRFETSSIEAGEYNFEMWLVIASGDDIFPDGLSLCLLAGSFVVEASLL